MSKNILTSLLLCLFTSISVGQVKVSDIVFKKKQIDLGAIYQESGVTSCVFEFTNNSTNDFVIRSLEVSCGCTTPHSNKKTYTPGESGKITVNFDPKGIVGKVNKWVQIRGNFSDALDVELTFNAEIKVFAERDKSAYYPGEFGYLLIEKLKLNWENKMNNAVFYDTVRLENDGYADIQLQEFVDLPSFIEPLNFPINLKPHELGMLVLKIDLSLADTIGPLAGSLKINTTDKYFKRKQIDYYLDVKSDYSSLTRRQLKNAPKLILSSDLVDMGTMKSGIVRTKTITITNAGKQPLIFKRIETDCSCAILKPTKKILATGESLEIPVFYDSLFKSGKQFKKITLYSNDPANPIQIITIKADVK